jgi:hypothetical protein
MIDYSKLPPSPPVDIVFLLDPLVATGGTACAALAMIVDWGIPGGDISLHEVERLSKYLYSEQSETPVRSWFRAGPEACAIRVS